MFHGSGITYTYTYTDTQSTLHTHIHRRKFYSFYFAYSGPLHNICKLYVPHALKANSTTPYPVDPKQPQHPLKDGNLILLRLVCICAHSEYSKIIDMTK